MAVFPKMQLTEKGEELLNRSIGEGKILTFTKFKIGSGSPPVDFRKIENLVETFKEFPVLETSIQKDKTLRIKGYFDNKGFLTDKKFKEIGIFVKLGDSVQEFLYSYTNAGDTGDIIPSESRGAYARTLDVLNYIGYATNITFNIEQIRDRYSFNTSNELISATFLKVGDKIDLWGQLVLGDVKTRSYIVSNVSSDDSFSLSNGLFANLFTKNYVKDNTEDLINSLEYIVGDVVEVLGYYVKGDGSGHKRVASATDDGSGIQGQGLWWNVIHNGEVRVSWFGFNVKNAINDDLLEVLINKYQNITIDSCIESRRTIQLKKQGIIIKGLGDSNYTSIVRSKHSGVAFQFNPTTEYNNNDQPKCPEFYNLTVECSEFYEIFDRNNKILDGGNYPYFLRPKVQKCFFLFNGIKDENRNAGALFFSKAFDFSVSECNFRGFPMGAGTFRGCDLSEFVFNRVEGFKREAITSISESTFGSDLSINHCDIMIGDCYADEINTRHVVSTSTFGDKITNCYMEYTGNVAQNRKSFIDTSGPYPTIKNNRFEGSSSKISGGIRRIENSIIISSNHTIDIDGVYNSISDVSPIVFENVSCGLSNNRVKNISIKNVETKSYSPLQGIGNSLVIDYSNISHYTSDSDYGSSLEISNIGSIIGEDEKILHISLNAAPLFLKSSGMFSLKFIYKSDKQNYVLITDKTGQGSHIKGFLLPLSLDYSFYELELTIEQEKYPYLQIVTSSGFELLSLEIEKKMIKTIDATVKLLDTPYYASEMQKEGVYEDFICYMDDKTFYGINQREKEKQLQLKFLEENKLDPELTFEDFMKEQPLNKMILQEPQPSEALLKFKEKYLG